MDYLDYLDYHVPPAPRVRPARYHDYNPFHDLNNEEFKDRFRFSKEAVNELIEALTPRIGVPDVRASHSIPNWKKVLVALRFFADGTFHRETGDLLDVSEAVSCKIVHKVAIAICLELRKEYIRFPTGDYARKTKHNFFAKYGFPNVLSCVDGTLIPIVCPSTPDKEEFRSRKGIFSINVLGAAGADLEFTSIVARWKGSTHDSRVLKNSSLYAAFEDRDMGGILIGDSGYECNSFLMTPLLRPQTPAERRYQRALIRTRSTVERMFGLLKNRFRCLHDNNTLRFSPRRSCIIIIACAILHNFGIRRGLFEDALEPLPENYHMEENDGQPEVAARNDGISTRNEIIRRHFTN